MKTITVNAQLISYECIEPHVIKVTFGIPKEELAGLAYSRPEFVLQITPAEELYK